MTNTKHKKCYIVEIEVAGLYNNYKRHTRFFIENLSWSDFYNIIKNPYYAIQSCKQIHSFQKIELMNIYLYEVFLHTKMDRVVEKTKRCIKKFKIK